MASNILAENELLQSIKQQINVEDVDYSKWERKKKSIPAAAVVGKRSLPAIESRVGSACSSSHCYHSWNKRQISAEDDPSYIAREKRMKEMQVKINIKKTMLDEMRTRKAQLLRMNMNIRTEMEQMERKSHGTVNVVLRRYERCRGGIANLHQRFVEEKVEKLKDLDVLRDKLNDSLAVIETEVDSVTNELAYVQGELQILHNYKDKEYPMRLILIEELQQSIENVKLDNEDEEAELMRVIDSENEKLRAEEVRRMKELKSQVADKTGCQLHPSLTSMDDENKQLKKDLDFHRTQAAQLNAEIAEMQAEIRRLKRSPNCDVRKFMFPELHQDRPKCTPDMDVVLDIPTQEPLPI